MSCLIWNARGLGNQRAIRDLRRLLAERNPGLIFICESKITTSQCFWWSSKFKYDGVFVVDSKHRRGGLILMWREPFSVNIQSYSDGHIDCIVSNNDSPWRFTGFYGNSVVNLRRQSWQLLQRLANIHELNMLPWLVGGDFNEILYESEKVGGLSRPTSQMTAFADVLTSCGLYDIHAKGDPYTWCNKRQGVDNILARLDRFICNYQWHSRFSFAEAENLAYFGSDHRPVLLCLQLDHSQKFLRKPKRFIFEHKWLLEEEFNTVFNQLWKEHRDHKSFPQWLLRCSQDLSSWAGNRFNHLGRNISAARKELDRLMSSHLIKNNLLRIKELEKQIEKLSDQEEIHWKQRARVNWLQHGDRNTRFFHAKASQRKATNSIKGLFNARGEWYTNIDDMADIAKDYFGNMFSTSDPNMWDIETVINLTDNVVGDHMNNVLCAKFSEEEIHKAVFNMHPVQSSRPRWIYCPILSKILAYSW